jgi:Uma2 family endonuclease
VPRDTVKLTDPVIVVELVSPSSRTRDHQDKLIDYFRLESVRHYLIVRPEDLVVVHHRRNDDGTILTRIVRDGDLQLDPPGLTGTGLFEAG